MTFSLTARHVLAIASSLDPAALQALDGAQVRLGGVDQLAAILRGGAPPDLVVVDGDEADASRLIPCLEALAAEAKAPPMLVTGARLPTRLVRAVVRLPRADLLETPFTADEFARMAVRLLTPAPPALHDSHCWSITGAVGGCGATTLAAEIASALRAQRPTERRVCLVDLNLADGAAAAYLGAEANMLLSQIAAPDRIDNSVLSAFLSHTSDGFDLLAAPRDFNAFRNVAPGVVNRILEVACQAYDWVVVDLPRHHQPWTLDVIAGSDELLLISELTVPALLAARAHAIEIETQGGPQPRIVLNRVATRMFSTTPSVSEAQKALGRRAEAGIASDWEAAAASVNLGGVVRRHRPRSKIVRDVDLLVARLVAESAQPAASVRTFA